MSDQEGRHEANNHRGEHTVGCSSNSSPVLNSPRKHSMKFFTGNMMRSVSLLASSFLLLLLIPSCHKNEPCTTCPPGGPDTTSHSFNFTQYTFGGTGGSSYFDDVAIINDSLAYAVGAVYLTDSLGNPDPNAYNLAKWNGNNWQLLRIEFLTFCGQSGTTSAPAEAIWCFNDSDVWIASSNSQITTWNGKSQGAITCLPVSVSKLWAVNKNAVYTVGPLGQIGYYDGSTWTKLESGTTVDLQDVWGTSDGKTVWACGYSIDLSQSCLLQFNGTSWKSLWSRQGVTTPPYGSLVLTIWSGEKNLYVGAAGIFRSSVSGGDSPQEMIPLAYVPHRIRGSAENNIAVASDDGTVWHYNGLTWFEEQMPGLSKPLYSIAVSANLVVAVGFDATGTDVKGRILLGRRE